jgi:hypothetical protein
MTRNDPAPLRELRDWLSRSVAEAEAILPGLLDLLRGAFHLKLRARPELRTAGMMQCLLDLAEKALGRFRREALNLTSVAVEIVDELALPLHEQHVARRLRAQAWKTHARALLGLRRAAEAHAAIATARKALGTGAGDEWYLATIDAIEAEVLNARGRREEAAALAFRAASALLRHDDHDGYLRAMMTRGLILHEDAGRQGMLDVTEEVNETADESLISRWKYLLGVYELRHGFAREAGAWLTLACKELRELGRTDDAIAAHRALAEAQIRLGRPNEAISERYNAYNALLGTGALDEAAVVAAQMVELVLTIPRRVHEIRSFAASLYGVFQPLGMPASALEALAWLGERAEAQVLTIEDAVEVRRYFEDRFLRPNAPFEAPTVRKRRIVHGQEFESALARLGTPANHYVDMLETYIAEDPGRSPVQTGKVRLLRVRAYDVYPALRIFYTYDEDAVYLIHVDLDDELAE